ncbi:MAG: serine/threonine-protein kinase [Vicinamibacterales bacterium]|nr:serine/threonine-protein kinase [Vicinamibacterales bacterium]
MEGTTIGRYRLLREIGRGGMGTVYLAVDETAEPRREVAIKVLRDALHAEHSARFLTEQRLLASLDHPGVARFLDGGTAPDGRPYLVMEFVAGEAIDAYCDRRQLTIPDRLRLFVDVLDAVAYAHRQLIVHRDIKPRNILVTEAGEVKLVDFGIAKPLMAATYADTEATRTGVHLMTPEYASPEQVTGGRITTATDIYGLGLLLYELLCGRRAQRLEKRVPGEIERVVVRDEAPRPSLAVETSLSGSGRTEISSDQIAVSRRTTPPRLARRLRGDLDRIVAMALRKEPELRYASVGLLAEDIDRFLTGQPVHARGHSIGYRASKFVGRHRVLVTAAAALVVMLAGYILVSLQHAAELQAALARAQQEAAKAEQVSAFMVRMFEGNDPDNAQGAEITGRELLDRGVARAAELSDEPVLQAQLLDTIGGVYRSLGEYARARPLIERALEARRAAHGETHADVAQSHRHLGVVLRFLGDFEGAEREFDRALATERVLSPEGGRAYAASLHELGHVYVEQGRFADGEQLFREALAMRQAHLGPGHVDVAESLSGVAYARSRQGFPRDAVPLYEEALAIHRQRLGSRHPQVARSHQNLAVNLSDLGEYDDAAQHYERALEVYRAVYGERHPSLAITINNLANLRARQGNLVAAEGLFRETLEMRRQLFAPDHPAVTRAVNNLATVLMRLDRNRESEAMFRELIAGKEARGQTDDPELVMYRSNLSETLRRQGRLAEAEVLARQVLEHRTLVEAGGLEISSSLVVLGRVLRDQGRPAEAAQHLAEALAIRRERLGDGHPDVASLEKELAAVRDARR